MIENQSYIHTIFSILSLHVAYVSIRPKEDQYHINLPALIALVMKSTRLSMVWIFYISILLSFTFSWMKWYGTWMYCHFFYEKLDFLKYVRLFGCHDTKQYYLICPNSSNIIFNHIKILRKDNCLAAINEQQK